MTQDIFKKPSVGVGICVIKDGMVLLGKRKGSHGSGAWSFPGGHLEFKEKVEECAVRELKEETGLIASYLKLGPWTNDFIEDKHYVTLFVFVEDFKGKVELMEPLKCEGWSWFDWSHLPHPLFIPIRSLIEKVGIEKLSSYH
jgi:8-oxo-dGTP diphosphatase